MKKGLAKIVVLCSFVMLPCLRTSAGEVKSEGGDWWYVPYPEPFDASKIETTLQFIHVEGNRFVDEDGNGLAPVSVPEKAMGYGLWAMGLRTA